MPFIEIVTSDVVFICVGVIVYSQCGRRRAADTSIRPEVTCDLSELMSLCGGEV